MEFSIDIGAILYAARNPVTFVYWLFMNGGWIFFVAFLLYGAAIFFLEYRRGQYDKNRKYIILALDIPKNNEQSPKAVEQIFAHLSGAQTSPKFEDKWIAGKMPESFSLEIISLGGYIQFSIQTPEVYRDLVEAAIYAQYPDAEIFEVDDYSEKFRGMKFPNDEYNLWGTELVLSNNQAFPIRTYPAFEHSLSQELKDPMAALLENLSKIGPDEQIWLQYTITPADSSWKSDSYNMAKKIMGVKIKSKKSLLEKTLNAPLDLINLFIGFFSATALKSDSKDPPSLMQYLSPGQKMAVEEIELKAGKIGFNTKARLIYIARKEAFVPGKRIDAIMGSLNQFASSNSFKNHKKKKTKVYGLFKEARLNSRRTRILRQYRMRARHYEPGYYGFILNTEELATLFHFPVMTVKAPLVRKTESKKAEPPITLPTEKIYRTVSAQTEEKKVPPQTPTKPPLEESDEIDDDLIIK